MSQTLIESLTQFINHALAQATLLSHPLPQTNQAACSTVFQNAYAYPISAGGKRLRPLLVLLTAGIYGGENAVQLAEPFAIAVEWAHTYSLVHDDLPCMDNDILRRGKPTTHIVFGEAQALLVGDALLSDAFSWLAKFSRPSQLPQALQLFSRALGSAGMVYGQWLDVCTPMGHPHTWEDIVRVHSHKTGCLFGACFALGALAGGVDDDPFIQAWRDWGIKFGLLFQIVDDLLDVTQHAGIIGKTPSKDQHQGKCTAVDFLGLEGARHKAILLKTELLDTFKSELKRDSVAQYVDALYSLLESQTERLF